MRFASLARRDARAAPTDSESSRLAWYGLGTILGTHRSACRPDQQLLTLWAHPFQLGTILGTHRFSAPFRPNNAHTLSHILQLPPSFPRIATCSSRQGTLEAMLPRHSSSRQRLECRSGAVLDS